jgi:hypothetical protein
MAVCNGKITEYWGGNLKNSFMKKQIFLMILIIASSGSGINAQPLENTTWKVYFPSGTFFAYYHIGVDTISISFDNITYTNTATYQANANNISTVDLYDGDCLVSDTGRYTFGIQNDTLKFSLISDPCYQRVTALTTFHFVRLLTAIQNTLDLSAMKICPNPASTNITIEAPSPGHFSILNPNGQPLITRQVTEAKTVVDISTLPSGVYVVKLVGEKGVQVGKVIKQQD